MRGPARNVTFVRLQVLTVAAFWDIVTCSLVEVDQRSEVLTASITRAIKRRSASTRLHGHISQRALIFNVL
jgi:hypothetical protein